MLRQTEIQHLDATSGHDDHVGSFQIAMNNAAFMSMRHGVGDLFAVTNHRLHGQAVFWNLLRQRTSADEFHDDVVLAVRFTDVIDGANVGMVQCGSGARLANQKRARVFVVVQLVGRNFRATSRFNRSSCAR